MDKFRYISKSQEGGRFAISDIHGCSETFKTLVQDKIKLEKTDQLFLLGDYINRGPDSKGVLDFILELKEQDFQIYALRGNHEQMILDYQSKSSLGTPSFLRKNGLFSKQKEIAPEYQDFIESLPYYFELDNFYLVHAGFDFEAESPFENTYAMMNIPEVKVDKFLLNGKIIIKGHTPVPIFQTLEYIEKREENAIICIDSGSFLRKENFGNLSALNLDTFELLIQKNIE